MEGEIGMAGISFLAYLRVLHTTGGASGQGALGVEGGAVPQVQVSEVPQEKGARLSP